MQLAEGRGQGEGPGQDPDSLSESELAELKRLRKENVELKTGPRDPAQGVGFFRQGDEPLGRFRFVSAYRDQYPVKALCRVARVSRKLKRELSWIHGPLIYMNRARLRSALFDYIEVFYNRERAQAGLGHLSPLDYEAALAGGQGSQKPVSTEAGQLQCQLAVYRGQGRKVTEPGFPACW